MNLFNTIRSEYGQNVVKQVRGLENTQKKLFRYRNHLVFALRCRDESITPPSLKLCCLIRTENARRVITKTEKSLVKVRIRTVRQKVDNLKSRVASRISRLDSLCPKVKTQVIALAEKAREREYKHVSWHQQKKLEALIEKK